MWINIKDTHEKFLEKFKNNNLDVYRECEVLEEYSGADKKILIRDKYGELLVFAFSLTNGVKPTILSAVDGHKYFLNMLKDKNSYYKNGDFVILNKYIDNSKYLIVEDKYGILKTLPSNLSSGSKPSVVSAIDRDQYNHNRIKLNYATLYNSIEILDSLDCRNNKRIMVRDKYGLCSVLLSTLLKGGGIKISNAVNPTEYWKNKARAIHGDKYDYSKCVYEKHDIKMNIKCNTCNNLFEQSAFNHTRGSGCKCHSHSLGENKISLYLSNNNILYDSEYKFKDCIYKAQLPFDFVIFNKDNSINCLLEYQGEQHYEPVKRWGGDDKLKLIQARDKAKIDYCADKSIKLIRIPYWDFDNIETILTKELNL